MWDRRSREDRRNSASIVELRRAAKLAQSRIAELSSLPSLRRANSYKESVGGTVKNPTYLKPPYPDYYDPDMKGISSSGVHGLKLHSNQEGRRHSSPRASPLLNKMHGSGNFHSLNYFPSDTQKFIAETRSVKDLVQCEGHMYGDEEYDKRSRSNGQGSPRYLSLSHIPENHNIGRRYSEESTSLALLSDDLYMSNYNTYDYFFKVLLLGNSGVGKTCLITKFRDGVFLSGTFLATVGIDYKNKSMKVDSCSVRLQFLDAAGQPRFRNIIRCYYRDCQAILLVFNVNSRVSYDSIRDWEADAKRIVKDPNPLTILVGNQIDVTETAREVTSSEGEFLAKELGTYYIETSAKTGHNVNLLFNAVARHLRSHYSKDPEESRFDIEDYIKNEQRNLLASLCSMCRIC